MTNPSWDGSKLIDIRYNMGVLDATYGAGGQGYFSFFLLHGACFELENE